MAWSKIKNIIIVILLALNICLLALIANQQIQSKRYNEETLTRTIEALERNGISVEREKVPAYTVLPSMSILRDEEKEASAAEFLLGEELVSSYSGGMSIHSSGNGSLSFYSGVMTGTLDLPWNEYDSRQNHAAAVLEGMGMEIWRQQYSENTVSTVPALNGIPIFNAKMELTYEGGSLTRIDGRFVGRAIQEQEQQEPITIATALVSLLKYVKESGTVCRSIESIELGYLVTSAGVDASGVVQCWLVETDTVPFYIDAATGSVTRAD